MPHHVVYVPGLGDNNNAPGQRIAVGLWRIWGVHPHFCQMNWSDKQPFKPKFDKLLALIDTLSKQGAVSLVGSSAGAAAIVNAFAARPDLKGVACIAGKINNPQTVGEAYKRKNPAFWESIQQTPASLAQLSNEQRAKIVSVYAPYDGVVPPEDSIVPGAHNRQVRNNLHPIVIATQLVFGAPKLLRFLQDIDKQA